MVFIYVGLTLARKRPFHMRSIPGLQAVEEAVGRATEMGKPVFYSPGYADVAGTTAPPTLAGLNLMAHVGRLAARYNTRLVTTVGHANTYALATEILRNAYISEGKLDAYDLGNIYFTTDVQFAYTAASVGLIQREKPATAFLTGYFAAEAIVLAEATAATNSLSISGTTNYFQIPFFMAACDYTMIGEEFLAAGAFISNDPNLIGSIAGQDYLKIVAILTLFLGAVLKSFGNNLVADLLKR
jgi:hypothetical protein